MKNIYIEQDIMQKFEALEKRLEENTNMVRQMRRYFLWTLVISAAVIVLPLVGLAIVIPQFINTYQNAGF